MAMPLRGRSFQITGDQPSLRLAADLLRHLGARVDLVAGEVPSISAFAGQVELRVEPDLTSLAQWATSGAMAITGDPDGPLLVGPQQVPGRMKAAALVTRLLARCHPHLGDELAVDGPALLGERAATTGLQREGQASVGRASRLLAAADGWVAVSLARATDFDVLPAWLGAPLDGRDPWTAVADWIRPRRVDDVVDGGQLLGLPVAKARLTKPARAPTPWKITSYRTGSPVERRPLVIDLSSLWAGPLCAGLLAAAGARVIKIESRGRPDGARRGPPEFFDLLNAGKESVVLDLQEMTGREQLRLLVDAADVVIESARPRVMQQWGFDVERMVADRTNLVWVSITGYGRRGPRSNWVAFGDDAAAAGGLLAVGPDGAPRFCGDAAADPATGLHAAAAALAALAGGGSHLIDIALSQVAAFVAGTGGPHYIDSTGTVASPPRARTPIGAGPALGRDTEQVLAELAQRPGR